MNAAREYYERIAYRLDEEDPACRTCRGAGYLRYDRPLSDPLFGKITTCWACTQGRPAPAPAAPEPQQGKGAPWWSK